MRKQITLLLWLQALLLGTSMAYAQSCPGTLNATVSSVTAATCPSNGEAVVTTDAPTGTALFFYIVSGPSGTPLMTPQSDGIYSSLLAGSYQVAVVCDGDTSVTDTVTFTVADLNVEFESLTLSVTNPAAACAGSPTPSVIHVDDVEGGNPPFQYAYYLGTDPDFDDALATYGSVDSQLVTTYGTYQVRVKDACGIFYTETIIVNAPPTIQPVKLEINTYLNDQPCAENTLTNKFILTDISGAPVDHSLYVAGTGFTVAVYASDASCGTGALLLTETLTTLPSGGNFEIEIPKGVEVLKYVVTNSCGVSEETCATTNNFYNPLFFPDFSMGGCPGGSGSTAPNMTISPGWVSEGFKHPITFELLASDSSVIETYVANSSAENSYAFATVPPGDYIIRATDACGYTVIKTISNPYTSTPDPITIDQAWTFNGCGYGLSNNVLGTKSVVMRLYGTIPGLYESSTTVTITSGPSNVGLEGTRDIWPSTVGRQYYFHNLAPGTYSFEIVTTCGTYTASTTVDSTLLLQRDITAEAYSLCTGLGGINLTVNNNVSTSTATEYTLFNATTDDSITTIYGLTFPNLDSGVYYVRMRTIDCNGDTFYTNSGPVTVLAPGAKPRISRALAMVCDGAITGTAYLTLAGAAPLKLEYKKASDATWTLYSTTAPSEVTLTGLEANQTYQVRLQSCGKSTISQFKVKTAVPITTYKNYYPCQGANFTARYPKYAGATYTWVKNATGEIVSTSNNYSLGAYDSTTMDGAYTLTISWGGCMLKTVNVNMNSDSCGYPTGSINISGTVFDDGNGLNDALVNGSGISTPSGSQLYVSLVSNGVVLTVVPVNPDGTYEFTEQEAGTYSVVLGNYPTGSAFTELPETWVNTGEDHNGASGIDGAVDGDLEFTVLSVDVTNLNFGINQIPTSENKTEAAQLNPGGSVQVVVPTLTGTDLEDGTYNGTSGTNDIVIHTLPSNGTLYYNGVAVTEGQVITNYNPALLTVDPAEGDDVTITFTYSHTDAAGSIGQPATVTMPFVIPSISGNIFDDGNGLTDNTVNGPGIYNPSGTPLYATLVDGSGTAVATVPVGTDGSYLFEDVQGASTYTVVVSTNPSGSTTPDLPTNWVNTGEHIGTTTGDDGTPNGVISVSVGVNDVTDVNFGIDHRPESVDKTQSFNAEPTVGTPFNLGPVPLGGSDTEDQPTSGTWGSTVKIVDLPTNGFILEYDGVAVTPGQVIDNFDITKLTIEASSSTPVGTNSTVFTYVTVDEGGFEDLTPATYTVTFDIPLPVVLIDFHAESNLELCANRITWSTSFEDGLANFELVASKDARTFETIATIPAKGAYSKYEYMDMAASKGTTYYKLTMIEKSGRKTLSNLASAMLACNGKTNIIVYPTQTQGVINIAGMNDASNITVVNSIGQVVVNPIHTTEKQYTLDISNLPSANYVIIVTIKGENYTFVIVKD